MIRLSPERFSSEDMIDMSEEPVLLDPDESQFEIMFKKLGIETVEDLDKFLDEGIVWLESELTPRISRLSRPLGRTSRQMFVDESLGVRFREGDLVRVVLTGECVLVMEVNGDRIRIKRGMGNVKPSGAHKKTDLLLISSTRKGEQVV